MTCAFSTVVISNFLYHGNIPNFSLLIALSTILTLLITQCDTVFWTCVFWTNQLISKLINLRWAHLAPLPRAPMLYNSSTFKFRWLGLDTNECSQTPTSLLPMQSIVRKCYGCVVLLTLIIKHIDKRVTDNEQVILHAPDNTDGHAHMTTNKLSTHF